VKALGIVGSPRKNGNTTFMVNEALSVLRDKGIETELVHLAGMDIRPCDGCLQCKKKLYCVIQDDDFTSVFRKMKEAQGIIIGSPVYFGSVTPQILSLLDRAAYVQRQTKEFFTGKIGAPIVVARRAGHNFALAQLLLWYFINDMIVVGSTYWNIAFGGSAGKRDVQEDTEGVQTIHHFARSMADLMKRR